MLVLLGVGLGTRSVSKLGKKLQRLDGVGPAGRGAGASTPPAGPEPVHVHTGDRAETLERLRQKIARIVSKAPAPPPPPAQPSDGELPFVSEQTPLGTLYVRHLPFEPHHRVGRFPVHVARAANTTMLSLLALDPQLASVDMGRALYLDTETTGLSGGTGTLPFLVGLGWFSEDGAFVVEQLLLRRPGEEAPILQRVRERALAASVLVTFNGKSFDMPLVKTRFVMNRMPALPVLPHLDLVHVARRVHKARIGACNLGSVESRVLGFGRVDDVPSGEVAGRYFHFLRTGDESALLGVVTHNVWDIVSMAALVGLYGEPLDGMAGEDLAGVASTLHRAKDASGAAQMADEAVARGGGVQALKTRALLAKARGDRDAALNDFEALIDDVDDPVVRLELAKLYEHHAKAYQRALDVVNQGVAERPEAAERRSARLAGKMDRQQAPTDKRRRRRRRPAGQVDLPSIDVEAGKRRTGG